MNVLITLTYYRPHYSGLTIYAEREARALVARGHRVTILTSKFDSDLKSRENCDGVEVLRQIVWFRVSKGVIMPWMLFQGLKQANRADIVHLHVPQLDAAPIALLSKLLGKPVILTYHCDLQLPRGLIHRIANWISDIANWITASAADVIVTNTLDYAKASPHLKRFLPKLVALYPPVEVQEITSADLQAFRSKFDIRPGQRIIGMAARLAAEKGVEYLVQAMPIVLERFPGARVLFVGPYRQVVGEETYSARIMPMIESLGGHWTFLGIVSPEEMAAFFKESEVIVLPSLNSTESFGIVQLEAMTSGTPVVASDLPGVRVPVQITGSGLIVPPGDAGALASALIEILQDPQRFRGRPEKLVSNSTPDAVAERYERIFEMARSKDLSLEELRSLDDETAIES